MIRLEAISCAAPLNEVSMEETTSFVAAHAPPAARSRLIQSLQKSRNRTRHSVLPLAALVRLGGATERAELYHEHARSLAERALSQLADLGKLRPKEISTIVFVSSTGYAAPSIETEVMRRFAINPHCRRIPLMQLGCAGGVAALSLAAEIVRGTPGDVLVISAELPSLQLQLAEPSLLELVAATQFGDGAAAAVVSVDHDGPEIIATESNLLAEVEEGGRVIPCETGLRLSGSARLPSLIRRQARDLVRRFTEKHAIDELSFVAAHPRGPEVLDAVADGLSLKPSSLAASWSAWESNGNMISASIFFALSEVARTHAPQQSDVGALLAFGTGVSCEMALLRWCQAPEVARS